MAYVKFPTASQAAKALEHLNQQTIKDGKVTVQLKVMFADPVDKLHNSENRCFTHRFQLVFYVQPAWSLLLLNKCLN